MRENVRGSFCLCPELRGGPPAGGGAPPNRPKPPKPALAGLLPAPFGDEVDAGCDLVGLGAVASAVRCPNVVEGVCAASVQWGDVVDGETVGV